MPQEHKNQLTHLKSLVDRMHFLHTISQKISEKKPLSILLKDIMEESKTIMEADASSLLLYESDSKELYFQVATGSKGKAVKKFSIPIGTGIAGWVAKHRSPLMIDDCYNDPRFNPEFDKKSKFRTKSMLCVPLLRKKKLIGVMEVMNKKYDRAFDDEDLHIFETLAAQCAIAIENAKLIELQIEAEALRRELDTARDIQLKVLPERLPEFDDIQIAAQLLIAEQVGGDYYNVIKLNDKESLLIIADVSGKGIPAALIVSTFHSCLQTFISIHIKDFDLLHFVKSLNRILINSTPSDKFVTCWFGLYNHQTKKLTSINAGHNSPLLFSPEKDEPIPLDAGGIFLGCLETPIKSETILLKQNDVLIFFTDGVTEAWNEKEEEYEEFRLVETVKKIEGSNASDILQRIEFDVKQHVGKAKQSDDFTCAVMKVN